MSRLGLLEMALTISRPRAVPTALAEDPSWQKNCQSTKSQCTICAAAEWNHSQSQGAALVQWHGSNRTCILAVWPMKETTSVTWNKKYADAAVRIVDLRWRQTRSLLQHSSCPKWHCSPQLRWWCSRSPSSTQAEDGGILSLGVGNGPNLLIFSRFPPRSSTCSASGYDHCRKWCPWKS